MHVYIVVKWAEHWGVELVHTVRHGDFNDARDAANQRARELTLLETDPRVKYNVLWIEPELPCNSMVL